MKSVVSVGIWLLIAAGIWADMAEVQPAPGGTVAPIENKAIRLTDEVVDITIQAGQRYAVKVIYHFENDGSAQKLVAGFPNQQLEPITNFQAWDGDQPLPITSQPERSGSRTAADGGLTWETFQLSFAAGQKKTVTNTYDARFATKRTAAWLSYILKTGALWKGPIGDLRIVVHFNSAKGISPKSAILEAPWKGTINGDNLEVHVTNLKPDTDFRLAFPDGGNYQ